MYDNMNHYKHIELRKLFVGLNEAKRFEGTPLESTVVERIYNQFKTTTAYKRSIRGRINASRATTISDLRDGMIQATREMTRFYNKVTK